MGAKKSVEDSQHCLLIQCADQKGLIAKIAQALFNHDLNIVSQSEFVDTAKKKFFLRNLIAGEFDNGEVLAELQKICPQDAKIKIKKSTAKKIVIFAGKEPHCLGDLLLRNFHRELKFEITAVVSNHKVLQDFVSRFDLPFIHIPHHGLDRQQHEAEILAKLKDLDFDFLVLAKYMRILSADFVKEYEGRIINIHHSFLPAFIGARPYHQAYDRGVKLIGATAHYVTTELDQGPIIAQDVIPVDHRKTPAELIWAGHNVERTVLAKALQLITEDRVFIHNNKTIIFE